MIIAPEYKIQLVNCKLSRKYLLGFLSLPDIRAIDVYILWSSLFSPLSRERLTFSLKRTCFCCFSLSFGGFGHFAIRWSSDPYLKHFRDVRSVCLLSEAPTTRSFSFYFLILLKHVSAKWLVTAQNVHFVWTVFAISLFLPKLELLSRFR